ncbi:hypothetical protein B296_00014525 [Ensete ventricosum]|uniref:Uncharacterized protein n=1 Tax=Ensete ventricosum TaxID=4639 RepID=A0A427A2K8_ENSVE|nr:hypothetical protein B296_00014525 [Ensete ventricosum]
MVRMVCRLTEESEHTAAIAPIRCRFCCVLTSLPVGSLYLSSPSRKHSTSTDGKRQRSWCKTSVDGKRVYGVDIFSVWREGHASSAPGAFKYRSRHTAECSRTRRRGSARFHEHPVLFFDGLFYLGIETLPPPSSLPEFALDFDTMASATAFFAPSYANAFPHGASPSFFHRSAYFSFGLPRSAFPALGRSSPLHKEPGFVPKPVRAPGVAYATAATEKSIHDFTVKVGP